MGKTYNFIENKINIICYKKTLYIICIINNNNSKNNIVMT